MTPPWQGFAGLRVVGDVHGEAAQFAAAIEGAEAAGLFLLQLGDLTDHGPDSPEVLRRMFALIDARQGAFLLGNHDHKLRRALLGRQVAVQEAGLGLTLRQLAASPDGETLVRRAIDEIARAPAWIRDGDRLFVHGAAHDVMLHHPSPPDAGARKPDGPLGRALFGEATGRTLPDGFPERLYRWIDRLPQGITVYCGHDRRSTDGRPLVQQGALGGRAVFIDTGAGKGGHLSWIDLPIAGAPPPHPGRGDRVPPDPTVRR